MTNNWIQEAIRRNNDRDSAAKVTATGDEDMKRAEQQSLRDRWQALTRQLEVAIEQFNQLGAAYDYAIVTSAETAASGDGRRISYTKRPSGSSLTITMLPPGHSLTAQHSFKAGGEAGMSSTGLLEVIVAAEQVRLGFGEEFDDAAKVLLQSLFEA
jgi:hypothetical protein